MLTDDEIKEIALKNLYKKETQNKNSDIFYLDDEGNIVEKENATRNIIRVTDENGMLIEEIYGIVEKKKTI